MEATPAYGLLGAFRKELPMSHIPTRLLVSPSDSWLMSLVIAGGYSRIDTRILDLGLWICPNCEDGLAFKVVDARGSCREMANRVSTRKMRAADLREMLAAAVADQTLGTRFSVVCVGSIVRPRLSCRRLVVCLGSCARGRVLDLLPISFNWIGHPRIRIACMIRD